MISPSSDFHDKIKDPSTYPQNLVLAFDDAYLSANDGDIEESGVEFDEYFCTAEDLSYGECPSSTMKATLINEDQMLRTISWGKCRAYIGYLNKVSSSTRPIFGSVNAIWEEDPLTFYARTTGFDINFTHIDQSGPCYSFIVSEYSGNTGRTVYAFGEGYAYKVQIEADRSTYTYELIHPNRFMTQKMKKNCVTIVWYDLNYHWDDVTGCHIRKGNTEYDWVYVPMGVFYVDRPSNLTGDIVTINEAQDGMDVFNVDASDFLAYMARKYPNGTYQDIWYDDLCSWCGYDNAGNPDERDQRLFKYDTTTSCTLRQILAQLANALSDDIDAVGCIFKFNRVGIMYPYTVGETRVEEVGVDRIEADTLVVSEYPTRPTTKLIVKNLKGKTYTSGSGDNAYYILGNPFVPDNKYVSVSDFTFYAYPPMSLTVLEADPAVEVGDKVGIWLSEDEYRLFIDNYNRVFTDENGNMFGEEITAVDIPLMHRVLTWNGVCTAVYECTGNPTRLVPSEAEQTTFNSAVAFPVSYTTDSFTETIPSATSTDYEISSGVYLVTLSNNSSATNKDGVWLLYNGSYTHIVAIVTPSDSSSISCADDVLSVTTATSNMHLCVVKIGD